MIKPAITLQEIKHALKNDEFIFYYQPKVSMVTGEINGAEALIRWQKPDGKIIPPSDFIPLAESSGFISEITKTMFQKLIVDVAIFDDVVGELVVSINASPKDFNDSVFVDHIRRAIEAKRIDSKKIEIELTESSLLEENDTINPHFCALIEMGVSLVMDDFGTGFSSIDILSKLPFSTIKLDQGVISRMEYSNKDKTIVESSIRMGHELGLDIVAEGIESKEVYLSLQNAGCTIAQGYWISRPLPLSDFLEFVRQKKRWPSTPAGLLFMAQLDHIHWRKALINGVFSLSERNDGDFNLRGRPASNAKSCMLGRWYYGLGRRFAGISAYDKLEEPHTKLHELGNALIEALEKGYSKTELVDIMRDLSKQSSLVIRLLQEIENGLLQLPDTSNAGDC
jgi:EAL domain-containing protein (putative c-di-GMP-specific phosphodiesterase class I)